MRNPMMYLCYTVVLLIFLVELTSGHRTNCCNKHSKSDDGYGGYGLGGHGHGHHGHGHGGHGGYGHGHGHGHGHRKGGKSKHGHSQSYDNYEGYGQSNYPSLYSTLQGLYNNYPSDQYSVSELNDYFSSRLGSLNYHTDIGSEHNVQNDYASTDADELNLPMETSSSDHSDHTLQSRSLKSSGKESKKQSEEVQDSAEEVNTEPEDIHQGDQSAQKSVKVSPKSDYSTKSSSSQSSSKKPRSRSPKAKQSSKVPLKADKYSSKHDKGSSGYDNQADILSNYPQIGNYESPYPYVELPFNYKGPFHQYSPLMMHDPALLPYNAPYEIQNNYPEPKPFYGQSLSNYEASIKPANKLPNYYTANKDQANQYWSQAAPQQDYNLPNPGKHLLAQTQLKEPNYNLPNHDVLGKPVPQATANVQQSYNPMKQPVNVLTSADMPHQSPVNELSRYEPANVRQTLNGDLKNYPVLPQKSVDPQYAYSVQSPTTVAPNYYVSSNVGQSYAPVQESYNARSKPEALNYYQTLQQKQQTPYNAQPNNVPLQEQINPQYNYNVKSKSEHPSPNYQASADYQSGYSTLQKPVNVQSNYDLVQNSGTRSNVPAVQAANAINQNYAAKPDPVDLSYLNALEAQNYYSAPKPYSNQENYGLEQQSVSQQANYLPYNPSHSQQFYSSAKEAANSSPRPNYSTAQAPQQNYAQAQYTENSSNNFATNDGKINQQAIQATARPYYSGQANQVYNAANAVHDSVRPAVSPNPQANYPITDHAANYYANSEVKTHNPAIDQSHNHHQEYYVQGANPTNTQNNVASSAIGNSQYSGYYSPVDNRQSYLPNQQVQQSVASKTSLNNNQAQYNGQKSYNPAESAAKPATNYQPVRAAEYAPQNYAHYDESSRQSPVQRTQHEAQQQSYNVNRFVRQPASPTDYLLLIESQANYRPIQGIIATNPQNYGASQAPANVDKQATDASQKYHSTVERQGPFSPTNAAVGLTQAVSESKTVNYQTAVPVAYSIMTPVGILSTYPTAPTFVNYAPNQAAAISVNAKGVK